MKKIKNTVVITFLLGMSLLSISGCTNSHNQGWNDLTPAEQEEVRQTLKQTADDVKEELENMNTEEDTENTAFIVGN